MLAAFTKKCAEFLGKPDVDAFTGHAYRRTSATIVADSGVSMLALKRHGRWKSDSVAQGYVADSKTAKLEVANIISGRKEVLCVANGTETSAMGNSHEPSSSKSGAFFSFGNCTFSNCVVNFVPPKCD